MGFAPFLYAYSCPLEPIPNRHEWQRGRTKHLPPFHSKPVKTQATWTSARFRRCRRHKTC